MNWLSVVKTRKLSSILWANTVNVHTYCVIYYAKILVGNRSAYVLSPSSVFSLALCFIPGLFVHWIVDKKTLGWIALSSQNPDIRLLVGYRYRTYFREESLKNVLISVHNFCFYIFLFFRDNYWPVFGFAKCNCRQIRNSASGDLKNKRLKEINLKGQCHKKSCWTVALGRWIGP